MKKFTDKQNEIFSQFFGALKAKSNTFNVHASALIDLDDENFIKLYTDADCRIIGTDEQKSLVNARANYLELGTPKE